MMNKKVKVSTNIVGVQGDNEIVSMVETVAVIKLIVIFVT